MVIGCRLDPVQVAYDWAGFGRNARKIMVDIDEREIDKISPPIDVPIVADAGRILAEVAVRAKDWAASATRWQPTGSDGWSAVANGRASTQS